MALRLQELEQPAASPRDLIGPYEEPIRKFAEREPDIIDQAILMWNVIHHVIDRYRERHSEWVFLRHEDLCEDPLKGFCDLYERLDLVWDDVVEDAPRPPLYRRE